MNTYTSKERAVLGPNLHTGHAFTQGLDILSQTLRGVPSPPQVWTKRPSK